MKLVRPAPVKKARKGISGLTGVDLRVLESIQDPERRIEAIVKMRLKNLTKPPRLSVA